jgi:hypothetical protein
MRLLGDYAMAVSPDLIMLKRHSGIPNDVARLRYKRAGETFVLVRGEFGRHGISLADA